MIKTIFKEFTIILLLCIAILLILSILFYDYNPINKIIPNKIAYTAPENIKNELEQETVTNSIQVQNKVYRVEGSDLNIYKKSQSYDPSKDNPFAATVEDSGTTEVENTSKNNVSNNSGNGATTNSSKGNTTVKNETNKGLK